MTFRKPIAPPERRLRRGGVDRRAAGLVAAESLEARLLLTFDPTPAEQHMLELLNRFRTNPADELELMTSSLGNPARSDDPDVDSALRFFETKGTTLVQQWASLVAVQPLAWNEALYNAAAGHTQRMIDSDLQTHQAPGEPDLGQRATDAGYLNYSLVGENVYAFARSVAHAHAGFAIDWGGNNDPNHPSVDGIQNPPGHRDNMMEATFREIGIRFLTESVPSTQVGPLLVTQNFGNRFNFGNAFLLGAVYSDSNGTGFYEAGEGLGGVTIQAVGAAGTYTISSMTAGGYQVQLPIGVYDISFSGAGFGSAVTYRNVSIGSQNVKLDAVRGVAPPAPAIAVLAGEGGDGAAEIDNGDTSPSSSDGTNFGRVNLAQSVTRTFTIANRGQAAMQLTGSPRVRFSGEGSSYFTLLSLPASLLAPGESTSFQVRFDPVDTLVKTSTIIIDSDDPNDAEFSFLIRAQGQNAPDVGILGAPGLPIADGDNTPTTSDGTGFGIINVSGRARARLFTITNEGSRALTLRPFTVGGSDFVRIVGLNPGDFRVTMQPGLISIAPGLTATFRVRFNPTAAGQRFATVQLRSNDPDEGTYDFDVRGAGELAPIVAVTGLGQAIAGGQPASDLNGTNLGSAIADGAGSSLVTRVFTIANTGSAALQFTLAASTRVTIEGTHPTHFRVFRQPPRSIAAGATGMFRVRFDPLALGDFNAVVAISPLNGGRFTFNISGMGV